MKIEQIGRLEFNPTEKEKDWVKEHLRVFNTQKVGHHNFEKLEILLKDFNEEIIGGILGITGWEWLSIDILWIKDSLRLKGLGEFLLETAEKEAIKRSCKNVCLDTFSFQALNFYKKQGYEIFGQLNDFPTGFERYFLRKRLY